MSMTVLFGIAAIVGVIAGLYLPMNGRLAEQVGSPLLATAVFFTVGALTAVLVWMLVGDSSALDRLRRADRGLLLLGVVSFGIILSATILIPRIGPGAYFVCTIAGQVIAGVALSHFGVLSPQTLPLTPLKALGVAALIFGVVLIRHVEGQQVRQEDSSRHHLSDR